MMVDNDVEDSLIDFLNRTNTFIQKDPEKVIDEIEHRLSERMEDFNRTKFDHPRMNTDVFISYSRSNKEIAKTLYETLTAKGLNVWYDMKNLSTGADFMEQIQDAIKTTKYFVALLSNHISEEVNDYHVYRKEWDYAIEQAIGLGREFILPVCEENFDMYNPNIKLPNRLKSHNAFFYKPDMDFSEIADDIMNKVNLL
jgi:WD-40 repeat protein